jgi:hypothetical protein
MKCDAFMNAVQSALWRGTSPEIQIMIGDQVLDVDHVENAEDDEGTIMVVADPPANPLEHLQLIIVYWEGDAELWSLAMGKVICVARDTKSIRPVIPMPTIDIDASFERQVIEWKGGKYDGSAPLHDEVIEYLAAHPEVIAHTKGTP